MHMQYSIRIGVSAAVSLLGVTLFALALVAPAQAQYYTPPSTVVPPIAYQACPALYSSLYIGLSDSRTQGQVSELQRFLSTRYRQLVTGYYGPMTYGNVVRFQQEQGVYPVTGGVGPLTRAAIQRVCGGGGVTPPIPGGISITNVSGPNSLIVGQQGTWSITTNAPFGSYLSASVQWGDEYPTIYPMQSAPSGMVANQTTFSHSYSQAGTYTIKFTVTDQYGRTTSATRTVIVGGSVQSSSVFYLNTPFTIMVGQTMKQWQGQLDFTLDSVNSSPYSYPGGYQSPVSARISLGQSCPPGLYCAMLWYPTQSFDLTVGQSITWQGYTVTLLSLSQNTATFRVTTGTTPQPSSVTVTSPTQGQSVAHGQTLPISWTVQNQSFPNSSVVVDLYTVSGSKIGTIAIQSGIGSGSYNWTVPTPNTICTQQYPNALCGQSLSGQYFIKVSIVSGSGFDSGATTYASGNSGTFTVN